MSSRIAVQAIFILATLAGGCQKVQAAEEMASKEWVKNLQVQVETVRTEANNTAEEMHTFVVIGGFITSFVSLFGNRLLDMWLGRKQQAARVRQSPTRPRPARFARSGRSNLRHAL